MSRLGGEEQGNGNLTETEREEVENAIASGAFDRLDRKLRVRAVGAGLVPDVRRRSVPTSNKWGMV